MNIALYDAPIAGMPGVKVNIGIDGYQLVTPLGTTVPFITNPQPQIVNVLNLMNSSQNSHGNAPLGAYSAVRMLVDASSSNVQIGSMKIPILWGTPGNVTTSPVVAIDFPSTFAVTGIGPAPTISMDFNVFQSVKFANNAIYVQPKVSASNAAAQIAGQVENAAGKNVANASVLAIGILGNVVNSTFTGTDGKFVLHALPPGMYTIQVQNSYTPATGETLTASGADAGASPSTEVILSPNDNVNLPTLVD
ncbi:MAG TPA: carboxypeptidase regulatory-like domain-containing protein [Candidatus Elarobacter sp.]|nr:carboxypeptidase regulatory-like domain-containing protein [Candidatus Elarobacter sp.]